MIFWKRSLCRQVEELERQVERLTALVEGAGQHTDMTDEEIAQRNKASEEQLEGIANILRYSIGSGRVE